MPTPPNSITKDPLLAPPTGMELVPLLRDELPPLRPPMLEVSPVTKRMENLDAMRIVCMLAIIVTHVTEPYLTAMDKRQALSGPATLTVLAINVMGRFGVPCFMMISFFIYWHQLYEKNRSWGELLARRFKRLIPAFLVWSLLYFAIHKALFKHFDGTPYKHAFWTDIEHYSYSLTDWHTWLHVLVYGQAEYHLYYLPLIMQCLICIPLLKILWKHPIVSWAWIGATSIAWTLMVYGPVWFAAGSPGLHVTDQITHVMYQPWAIPFLLFPLFGMMVAGQKACRHFVAHTPTAFWIGLLIFGLALHSFEAIYLSRALPGDMLRITAFVKVGRIVTAIAVFCLFIRHPLMRDPFPRVSHYAFGLHFMHPAVILLLTVIELHFSPAVAQWQSHAMLALALNLLLTFSITFSLCLIIGRSKKLEFLVV